MSGKQEKTPFEDALDATGFGFFNIGMLLLCGSLVMAMVFESISLSFLVAGSACELQTSSVEQGLLAGMPLFGIIASSHIWGYLADTRGRRKILLLSLMLGFSTGVISAFSPNWIVLALFKVISSAAVSGTFALAMTLLSECTPRAKRNSMIILSTSVFMMANGIMADEPLSVPSDLSEAPSIYKVARGFCARHTEWLAMCYGPWLCICHFVLSPVTLVIAIPVLPLKFSHYISFLDIYFNSWRLLSLIYTMPCALAALGVYYSVESPKYLLSIGEETQALNVLKTIHRLNNGTKREYKIKSTFLDEEGSAQKSVGLWASVKSQTIPLLKPPLLKSTLKLSVLFVCIYMCVNPYIIWLPTVIDGFMRSVERGETSVSFCDMIAVPKSANTTELEPPQECVLNQTAMISILAISLLFTFLNTVMSGFVTRFGRRRLFIGIQGLAGLMGLCINFSTNAALSAVMFVVYLGPMLDMGLITTFTVDIYPTHLRAMAVCLTVMVGRGSAILGINILKDMLINNCEASFYLFSSISLVCAAVAFLLPADEKAK